MRSKRKLLLTAAFTALLGVSTFAGISLSKDSESFISVEAAATTTKETDATGIYYNDKQGWCFRSLHFYNVSYASGYTYTDFETYLTGFYGAKISSWTKQGTTRGWGLNGGTAQDYMICDGGTQKTHSFIFPWWVSSFTFQIVNNDNWLCNWGVHGDWGIHTKFDLEVDGTSVTHNTGSMSPFVYDFPAVTISKVAVDSSTKQVITEASIPGETTSIYDKYPNGGSTPDEPGITVDGYLFDGWYTNQNLTTPFSKKVYTSDATIYAKYNECPTTDVYLDVFNWNNLYIYTFETIGGNKVEYYGPFPGKKLSIVDTGLKFNGGMLQKVAVPFTVQANAKFVYSNGTDSNKSSDLSVVTNAYYWHNGTAWTSNTTNYGTAAEFVYGLNDARLKVPASASTKEYSICGLNAKSWVDDYDALTNAARTNVNSASIYTYKDQSSSGADTTVTFAEIISQLRKSAYSNSTRIALLGNLTSESSASIIIIISISAVCLAAVGGYFLFRKKKEN